MLADGGRLALWDITIGDHGLLDFPLPWAEEAEHTVIWSPRMSYAASSSPPVSRSSTRDDLTEQAGEVMQVVLAQPPSPLGLHAFVADFSRKARKPHPRADGRTPSYHPGSLPTVNATRPDEITRKAATRG